METSTKRPATDWYGRFNSATAFEPWRQTIGQGEIVVSSASFNSATAFEPWRRVPRVIQRPRPGRGFNSATAFEPWRHPVSMSHPPTPSAGFNSATAFEPWRQRETAPAVRHHEASIRPRLLSRGDVVDGRERVRGDVASIRPRLLSRGDDNRSAGADRREIQGFNSATAFEPWRRFLGTLSKPDEPLLQFGHGF